MSYPSQHRLPYGMTTVQPIPGMPGMAGVAAMPGVPAGMAPVQVGVPRVQNGMGGMYQAEKSAALYPGAAQSYPGLAQHSYLAQTSLGGQPGAAAFYGASSHPTYLPVTSPSTQQRYMVSAGYPGAGTLVSSPSLIPGAAAAGYPLTAGAGYSLSAQPSSLGQPMPVAATSLSSHAQSQYPTYIGSQFTPLQISPSQSPYAASATGHPLYPGSTYTAGLQMAGAQVPSAQMRSQPGAGLPIGYTASQLGSAGFYPVP